MDNPVAPPSDGGDQCIILPDGTARACRRWRAVGRARACVLALHAFGNHAGTYEEIGPLLAQQGFDVLAYDHRGFGEDRRKGVWPQQRNLIEDCRAVAQQVREDNSGIPLVLFGESMGGSVAIIAAAEGLIEPDAIVLAAPGVREGVPYRWFYNIVLFAFSSVVPRMGVTIEHKTGYMTPGMARRFADDPHIVRFVSVSDYYGLIRLADRASEAVKRLALPVFLGHGSDDTTIPAVAVDHAARHLAGNVEHKTYPDGPHALLHWAGRGQMLEDMLAFLDRHVKRP